MLSGNTPIAHGVYEIGAIRGDSDLLGDGPAQRTAGVGTLEKRSSGG